MRGESIAYILRRRQEEAGVDSFSPHDLRRSTVTHLLDARVDVFTVQKLAGHAEVGRTCGCGDDGTVRPTRREGEAAGGAEADGAGDGSVNLALGDWRSIRSVNCLNA